MRGGRAAFTRGPLAAGDPLGRCGAVVVYDNKLAVLPAMVPELLELDEAAGLAGAGRVPEAGTVGNSYVDDLGSALDIQEVGVGGLAVLAAGLTWWGYWGAALSSRGVVCFMGSLYSQSCAAPQGACAWGRNGRRGDAPEATRTPPSPPSPRSTPRPAWSLLPRPRSRQPPSCTATPSPCCWCCTSPGPAGPARCGTAGTHAWPPPCPCPWRAAPTPASGPRRAYPPTPGVWPPCPPAAPWSCAGMGWCSWRRARAWPC